MKLARNIVLLALLFALAAPALASGCDCPCQAASGPAKRGHGCCDAPASGPTARGSMTCCRVAPESAPAPPGVEAPPPTSSGRHEGPAAQVPAAPALPASPAVLVAEGVGSRPPSESPPAPYLLHCSLLI